MTTAGVVQTITVDFASVGFNAKVAIYADSKGLPSTLLTQSISEYVRQTGLHTFTVSQKSLDGGL